MGIRRSASRRQKCRDKRSSRQCASWKIRHCKRHRYVRRVCKRTCGLCHAGRRGATRRRRRPKSVYTRMKGHCKRYKHFDKFSSAGGLSRCKSRCDASSSCAGLAFGNKCQLYNGGCVDSKDGVSWGFTYYQKQKNKDQVKL